MNCQYCADEMAILKLPILQQINWRYKINELAILDRWIGNTNELPILQQLNRQYNSKWIDTFTTNELAIWQDIDEFAILH